MLYKPPSPDRVHQWREWHDNGMAPATIARRVKRPLDVILTALNKRPTHHPTPQELMERWAADYRNGVKLCVMAAEWGYTVAIIHSWVTRVNAQTARALDPQETVSRWRDSELTLGQFARSIGVPRWWMAHHAGVKRWRHMETARRHLRKGGSVTKLRRKLGMNSAVLNHRITAFRLDVDDL